MMCCWSPFRLLIHKFQIELWLKLKMWSWYHKTLLFASYLLLICNGTEVLHELSLVCFVSTNSSLLYIYSSFSYIRWPSIQHCMVTRWLSKQIAVINWCWFTTKLKSTAKFQSMHCRISIPGLSVTCRAMPSFCLKYWAPSQYKDRLIYVWWFPC